MYSVIADKDELSPLNIVMNGCYDYDKKKKGPTLQKQEELCRVCGDRALGNHYNALPCEECKGKISFSLVKTLVLISDYIVSFIFKLIILSELGLAPLNIGNPTDLKTMFLKLKKENNFVLNLTSGGVPEYQCVIKQETKKDKDKPNSTTMTSGSDEEEKPMGSPPTNINCQSAISITQEALISRLVVLQEKYESVSEDDIKRITAFPLGDSEKDIRKRFQHFMQISILTAQLIFEFSKRVWGFECIPQEDQMTLLKACCSELELLRTARKYDMRLGSVVLANKQRYTRENFRSACMGDSVDYIFNFYQTMCSLKVDNAEYALLTAIVIFSVRPCLLQPKEVINIQYIYIETLRSYMATKRPPGKNYFARLLSTLIELHTLGNINYEQSFFLEVDKNV
ncbi:ecdysone receptor [Trichonephila inaurata madagascariensis]|uniref:Ecdysone receptor n=1 Tax=Trichonephila inaurata madagascariensis TaxID=2747483 RepID=A0A8X7BV44_9ARAC|nr:ecdysone receptor [Trichonephila inaurata madagascariensis]